MVNMFFKVMTKLLLAAAFLAGAMATANAQIRVPGAPIEYFTKDEIMAAAKQFYGDQNPAGLEAMIDQAFKDLGAPDAYFTGTEDSGITEIGYRYGNGRLYHKGFSSQRIYWRGPSIGFDLMKPDSKVFTLVYNLMDYQSLFKRFMAGETGYYYNKGAALSYRKRLDLSLAQIRLDVELAEGLAPYWVKYADKPMVVPNVIPNSD